MALLVFPFTTLACHSSPNHSSAHGIDGSGGTDGGSRPAGTGGTPGASSGGSENAGAGGAAAGTGNGAGGSHEPSPIDAGSADAGPGPGVPVPPPDAGGCYTDVSAGSHEVPCDGITYTVSVPEQCLTTQCGLVFDVHGGTMSGAMEDKNTNLAALGKKYGYVVVDPSAPNGLWNYATDDDKVYAFMVQTRAIFHTDPKRTHMTGLSQGGYMTWRFACHHTDFLASVAPAAAAGAAKISAEVGCTFTGTDVPTGEIDILYMHGIKDALVDFQNAVTLRDAVVEFYKASPGKTIAGDATYSRLRYTMPGGHVFEFIQHDYVSNGSFFGVAIQGHCFPGSPDQTVTLPGQLMPFGCVPPNSFTWGEEVIHFFMEHPKRASDAGP